MLKGCLISILVLLCLVLAVVGAGYHFLTQPTGMEREMVAVPLTSQAASSLDQKFEDFEAEANRALAAGERKEVALVLTEQEGNSKIAQLIAEGQIPKDIPAEVKKLLVNFRRDRILALAEVTISGFDLKVGGEATVEVKDNRLRLKVEKIALGRLPLPQAIKDRLMGLIPEEAETFRLGDLPVELRDIRIQDGQLILRGITRGKG